MRHHYYCDEGVLPLLDSRETSTQYIFDIFTFSGDGTLLWHISHLAALLQLLLHLVSGHVHIDDEVRRQELAEADAFDLVVVVHACSTEHRGRGFVQRQNSNSSVQKCSG